MRSPGAARAAKKRAAAAPVPGFDLARLRLRGRMDSEREGLLAMIRDDPWVLAGLVDVLLCDDPRATLAALDPEIARMIFLLAALQCGDIAMGPGEAGGH